MIALVRRAWIVAVLTLSACVPGLHVKEINVATDQSPTAYNTYRWQPTLLQEATVEERPDEQYSEVIVAAIDRVLAHHGYERADNDATAMIVDFQLTVKESVETYESVAITDPLDETLRYGLRWRLPDGDKPLRLERMAPDEEIRYLDEGTLHIAVFAPDKAPLWHATGHKVLNRSHTQPEHHAVLEKSVAQMLARFPARTRPPMAPRTSHDANAVF